jgi:hypothetical protein
VTSWRREKSSTPPVAVVGSLRRTGLVLIATWLRGSVVFATVLLLSSALPACASLARSQPRALAQALNLTLADVPGFSADPQQPPAFDKRDSQCPGAVPRSRWLAYAASDTFDGVSGASHIEVSSAVTVLPTRALAERDLAALRSRSGRECIAAAFKRAYANTSIKLLRLSVKQLPASTPGGVGLRVTLRWSGFRHIFTLYQDAFVFVRDRAEVALDTSALGQPFPAALEHRLSEVLVARAKQHLP